MFYPTDWKEMDYTPEVPRSDDTMWTAQWSLESPAMGGRILAHDARSTVVYAPNCNPWNENEQRVARLLLYSREMLNYLNLAASVLEFYKNPLAVQIDALIAKVEDK